MNDTEHLASKIDALADRIDSLDSEMRNVGDSVSSLSMALDEWTKAWKIGTEYFYKLAQTWDLRGHK